MVSKKSLNLPDDHGKFGDYGGKFVPETLMSALTELEQSYQKIKDDKQFNEDLSDLLHHYAGRPTAIYHAKNLSAISKGAQIFLKREDLAHTGAHKINNALGQALLAKHMGKTRIIAETGAGQHGVATATVCSMLGLKCIVYMGSEDIQRQSLNVFRMRLLEAEVIPVESGSKTLKDAINEAIRDWVTNVDTTHYIIGSVVGPAPYPALVRDFQRVIGDETVMQLMERGIAADAVFACVGGGSNAIGIFTTFLENNRRVSKRDRVELVGVEAAGHGIETGLHSASIASGEPGVLHGNYSYLLQDEGGQVMPAHSISAGLDYPGVGPEHSFYRDTGRAEYVSVTDQEALEGFELLARTEGIIPALETAHAVAYLPKLAESLPADAVVVLGLSGRGDKDME